MFWGLFIIQYWYVLSISEALVVGKKLRRFEEVFMESVYRVDDVSRFFLEARLAHLRSWHAECSHTFPRGSLTTSQ